MEQQMSIVAREIGKLRRIELLLSEMHVTQKLLPISVERLQQEVSRIRKTMSINSVVIRNAEKEVKNNFKKVTIL
jgi:hypothetical protein